MYKKEYEEASESKDEDWRKKHGYKKLNKFSYQVDIIKKDKVYETDEETDEELDE